MSFVNYVRERGAGGLVELVPLPNLLALQQVAVFGVLQAALMLLVPCKIFEGPITPHGNRPLYKVGWAASC